MSNTILVPELSSTCKAAAGAAARPFRYLDGKLAAYAVKNPDLPSKLLKINEYR